jgi:rubrerythrin
VSKKKYCKLCEPIPELIDKDSPIAVGYFIRGKRKIPVCDICAEAQERYHKVEYYGKKESPKKIECNHPRSDYEKKNLVVIPDDFGGYDILKCRKCGNEIKRRGLGV